MKIFNKKAKLLIVSILAFLCVFTFDKTNNNVYANSAQSSWFGITVSGIFVTDKNCPLKVSNENLIFDIQEFPSNYYTTSEEFLAYSAKVKAEYTFYNPEDYTVNATLLFPFGDYPDYYYGEESDSSLDTTKYDITVNNEAIIKNIRHSLSYYDFEIDADMAKIRNDYETDNFFCTNLPVTIYYFDVSGITELSSSYASFEVPSNFDNSKIIISPYNGFSNDNGKVTTGAFVKNDSVLTIAVLGENIPTNNFNWKVYKDASEKKIISGNVTLNETKTQHYSFLNYTKKYYVEDGGISEIDWYNAVVDNLNINRHNGIFLGDESLLNIKKQLLRWFEYDITVPPKSEIINTVNAPLYPFINLNYSSPVFSYKYLLSPAKTWASFGNLNIVLNTPFYITKSSLSGYEKTEKGYKYTFSSLPEGELNFNLCSIENPTIPKNNSSFIFVMVGLSISLVLIIILIFSIIIFYRKKNKNNEK